MRSLHPSCLTNRRESNTDRFSTPYPSNPQSLDCMDIRTSRNSGQRAASRCTWGTAQTSLFFINPDYPHHCCLSRWLPLRDG